MSSQHQPSYEEIKSQRERQRKERFLRDRLGLPPKYCHRGLFDHFWGHNEYRFTFELPWAVPVLWLLPLLEELQQLQRIHRFYFMYKSDALFALVIVLRGEK